MKRLFLRWLDWRRTQTREEIVLVVGRLTFDGTTVGPIRMGWYPAVDNGLILDRLLRTLSNGVESQYDPLVAPSRGIALLTAIRGTLKNFDTKTQQTSLKQEFSFDRGDTVYLYGTIEILVTHLGSPDYTAFCGEVQRV